jgi:hypothetical protein
LAEASSTSSLGQQATDDPYPPPTGGPSSTLQIPTATPPTPIPYEPFIGMPGGALSDLATVRYEDLVQSSYGAGFLNPLYENLIGIINEVQSFI